MSLEIPSEATSKRIKPANYVLCAVQNHLGISAHGGHYVANVLDWTTGVWYEFNDEQISILEGGPASTFDPSGKDNENSESQKKISGSQDAYNLLYVERGYLATQCKIELRTETADDSIFSCDVKASIKVHRRERYTAKFE